MKETGLTGKRRSTTIAATPDDGNSQRKRRRRRSAIFSLRSTRGTEYHNRIYLYSCVRVCNKTVYLPVSSYRFITTAELKPAKRF